MSRLVVVSNRVAPITEGEPAAGGLAIGVLDALKPQGGIWFGWSGEVAAEPAVHPAHTIGAISVVTIDLSRRDYDEFYRGFANGTLWPVLHYQIGLARFDWAEFTGYRRVNELFAHALALRLRPDDMVWAHDYHLLCFAEALRAAGATNRMGLFLHTPFPEPGVLMTIPAHAELVRAMCNFDLLGFQTATDRTAFVDYVVRHGGGTELPAGALAAFDRVVATGVYPIGVDTGMARAEAELATNRRQALRLRDNLRGRRLILSVDRLDYSKGLRQRFVAFERFLQDAPASHGEVIFMQIAPPSRSDVQTYREIRRELEAEAGRINGRFADVDWVPLQYLNRSFPRSALMSLYAEARVGLVTPLRDGMNLVAKEYVAAQDPDDPGVLVLSKFAGAANELDAALLVDPHDLDGVGRRIAAALVMPLEERRARWQRMMDTLLRHSIHAWFADFMKALKTPEAENVFPLVPVRVPPRRIAGGEAWAAHT
ncbi:MAG TPA: trehalose-6-phosphate synthase [Acetobacteraceae bacterium]|nr:trehalose-6-phosphate synthase [Acetobacteraceae bacterium]